MFTIANDVLHFDGQPVRQMPTEHVGGRIVPTCIVLHDTAGRLDPLQSARYLQRNPSKVSAHLVIERDGSVSQLAPFDVRASHAGKSSWRGRDNVNGFSVGIEIVNPGRLDRDGVSWFGVRYSGAERGESPAHKPGYWLPYTREQLETVAAIVAALRQAYPTIVDVVGHHDISPGRKEDPTPLMPWQAVRSQLPPVHDAGGYSRELERAQQRLDDLGYPVGLVDGLAGPRTVAAVSAFQQQHGLPITGRLDLPTTARLMSETAKPIPTGHREDTTPAELARSGSTEAQAALADRRDGAFQAALAAVTGTLAVLKSTAETIGTTLMLLAVCGVALLFAVRQIWRGNTLAGRVLREYITGRRT